MMHETMKDFYCQHKTFCFYLSQELTGVIDYVKLLLIDSTVFAEEVEPTGVVPMELSLER